MSEMSVGDQAAVVWNFLQNRNVCVRAPWVGLITNTSLRLTQAN